MEATKQFIEVIATKKNNELISESFADNVSTYALRAHKMDRNDPEDFKTFLFKKSEKVFFEPIVKWLDELI